MPEYVDLLPEDTSPSAIEEGIYEDIRSRWPDWEPAEGNLEVWLIKSLALRLSELYDLVIDVADEVFAQGGPAVGIPRHEAQPATAMSTWTMVDDSGYHVDAGTLVEVVSAQGSIAMETVTDLIVPQGQTTGQVGLVAVEPGSDGNGYSGQAQLIDALIFVEEITLDAPTANGTDEEDLTTYLNRLAAARRLLSIKAITAAEFAILAEQDSRVLRAVGIHGLDPETPATDVPLTTTVAVMGLDGNELDDPTMAEIKANLEAGTVVGMQVFVVSPDYTDVDVDVEVTIKPGFDGATVRAQVKEAIEEYLSPATWGQTDDGSWINADTVYLYELISLVDRVPGVDRVVSLKLEESGTTTVAADLSLGGDVPVARAGTVTVS